MYEVRLSSSAEQVYVKLDRKMQERIDRVFEQMEQGIFRHNNICALHGPYTGSLRYRLGPWRIIFQVDSTHRKVWIEAITTRGGAYR